MSDYSNDLKVRLLEKIQSLSPTNGISKMEVKELDLRFDRGRGFVNYKSSTADLIKALEALWFRNAIC